LERAYILFGLRLVLQAMITVFGLGTGLGSFAERKITNENHRRSAPASAASRSFYRQLQVNSLWAFAGCAAIVVGAYAAAHGLDSGQSLRGEIHPATMVSGR
jgi:hypothetical protein